MNHRTQARLLISLFLLTTLALGACSSQKSGSADRRISATIGGLLGSGLVIQTNGGNNVSVVGNGSVLLAYISSGARYEVTVKEQPRNPAQTCTVSNGSGVVGDSDVSDVSIVCTGGAYRIMASVSGLAGQGLVLQEESSGSAPVTVTMDGTVTLASQLTDGSQYSVKIMAYPSNPTQTCTFTGSASGSLAGANVTVAVSCVTNSYAVSGIIVGYTGSGLILQEGVKLGPLPIPARQGTFGFSGSLLSGSSYSISVATQPTSSGLTCFVINGKSTVTSSDVHVAVLCRPISSVSAGDQYSLAIKSDGTLWGWGYNHYGQLGTGNTTDQRTPTSVNSATDWAMVSAGLNHATAIKTGGTLWTWGDNSSGQLGDGTQASQLTPEQIGKATNWAFVSASDSHTVALRTDGTLWAWGNNDYGQLGIESRTSQTEPKQIGTATDWAFASAGSSWTVALKTDGSLWAWGGGIGALPTSDPTTPERIGTATNWNLLSAGGSNHALAITTDNSTDHFLYAWGSNPNGELGDSTTTDQTSPEPVGSLSSWALFSAGGSHSVALMNNGTLWAWGSNSYGQLGDNSTTKRLSPVPIKATITDWALVAAGGSHSLALRSDGSLWSWGSNAKGQLGSSDSTLTQSITPIQVWQL